MLKIDRSIDRGEASSTRVLSVRPPHISLLFGSCANHAQAMPCHVSILSYSFQDNEFKPVGEALAAPAVFPTHGLHHSNELGHFGWLGT